MVTLKKVSVGTELNIVQEGLPDVIPLEACYLGWQESFQNLARLVEPEINQFSIMEPACRLMGFATLSPSYKLQVWLGPHRL